MAETIAVEVAFVDADRRAFLERIELGQGATVADAIAASGIEAALGRSTASLAVGIWSKIVERDAVLADGDRVELYRELVIDPKEARRRRAAKRQPC